MDKLDTYRRIAQQVVAQHAKLKPSEGQIEPIAIGDARHDNYLLLDVGWDTTGRVHEVVLHLRIYEGKIWVERDGTESGVTQELLGAGVPKEDIVLAFYRPERRALTDFAST